METKKVGRPREKEIEFLDLDQAMVVIKEALLKKYNNPALVDKLMYAPRTLFNMRCSGKLTKYRDRGVALFAKHEILKLVA